MARTTEEEVRLVLETDADIDLTLFIQAATALTDRIAACAAEREWPLTSEELRIIESYLAAHFYSLKDPLYKSKRTERAEAEFLADKDQFWDAAVALDTSGCLDSFGKPKARVAWLGKPPSAQTDYVDRD